MIRATLLIKFIAPRIENFSRTTAKTWHYSLAVIAEPRQTAEEEKTKKGQSYLNLLSVTQKAKKKKREASELLVKEAKIELKVHELR